MSGNERPRRKNGLERPYRREQVSTWVTLPVLLAEFYLAASPLLVLEASLPCTVLLTLAAAASVYYAYRAMAADPVDPRLASHGDPERADGHRHDRTRHLQPPTQTQDGRPAEQHGQNVGRRKPWDENEPTKHCWICDNEVGHKSMHCKFCNKCVDHFDHHCMWLNTCVGKTNYVFFYRTMVSITSFLVVHVAPQIYLILDIYLGNGDNERRAKNWFDAGSTTPVIIVMGIFVGFDIIALSLIGQLLNFHHFLQREGLTTYAFIVKDTQKKREKAQQKEHLRAVRDDAVENAKIQGKSGLALRLQIGGVCRNSCNCVACDPLEVPQRQDSVQASGVGRPADPESSDSSMASRESTNQNGWHGEHSHDA